MHTLNDVVTALSLDPFAALQLASEGSALAADRGYSAAELSAALQVPPAGLAALDWSSCDTCSDPGPDEFDPFG